MEASTGIPKFYVEGLGVTIGASTYGLRAGLDLNLGIGQCQDACGFYGLVLGTDRRWRKEYYLGVTLIGMYMGSVFAEADIKFRDKIYNGIRVSAGLGIYSLFGYLALGYEAIAKQPSLELGVTAKLPVTYFGSRS